MTIETEAEYIDREQAGKILGVSELWIKRNAKAFGIPQYRIGKFVRFRADDLRSWAQSQREG